MQSERLCGLKPLERCAIFFSSNGFDWVAVSSNCAASSVQFSAAHDSELPLIDEDVKLRRGCIVSCVRVPAVNDLAGNILRHGDPLIIFGFQELVQPFVDTLLFRGKTHRPG